MITNKSGVYCFRNKLNNKIYIGSSNCIKQRYANHKSKAKEHTCDSKCIAIANAFKKYGFKNFEFKVLLLTDRYYEWEEILIRLLKPEYNIAFITNGKHQPNLGKKFSKKWIDKLGRCNGHSKDTRKLLTKLNKAGGCDLLFEKDDQTLSFTSWVDASNYFNTSSGNIQVSFSRTGKYRDYEITRLSVQRKRVKLSNGIEEEIFDSSYACDRFLDLWRGATSNAIRNNSGVLHNYKVEYI